MTRRSWWLLLAALLPTMVLAFSLRDAVYRIVIVPLAYVFWLAVYYYSFIPQLLIWIVLLVVLMITAFFGFLPTGRFSRRLEAKPKLTQGPVESLAMWLVKSRKGTYFKWQVANRLGRTARKLGWMPGERVRSDVQEGAITNYLEAGLTTSFVDYPNPKKPFGRSIPTPLDIDPEKAVDYLESQMEMKRGRHS